MSNYNNKLLYWLPLLEQVRLKIFMLVLFSKWSASLLLGPTSSGFF